MQVYVKKYSATIDAFETWCPPRRCPANMAHARQARPESGLAEPGEEDLIGTEEGVLNP